MPPPIGRRRVEEFRRAFTGEINSLAALYRDGAADMMDVLADAATLAGQRGRAVALLRQYQTILADLGDEAAAWIEFNIPRAYDIGLEFADEGVRNIRRAGINLRRRGTTVVGRREREVFSQVHREAARAIMESMLQTTSAALVQIGRRVDDVFRREGMLAVARGIAAGRARIEVSRELEQRLIAAGRPTFVDALGRQWPLDRYAEMVARTTTREAMTQGTINRLREHGVTLAQVSAHNAEDFCRYYENAVVSLDGPHPVYPPITAINGGPPFHPRCLLPGQRVTTRHGLVPIEKVRVGDEVLTHRGRYRAVTEVFARPYEGPVVTLMAGESQVSATPEHPFLCPWGWIAAGHVARHHVPLAVGQEGQDFGQDLPWVGLEALRADAHHLPSLLGQESISLSVTGAPVGVPVVLPIELHVKKNGREREVEHVATPRHLEAPSLRQMASGEQICEFLLRGGRPAAAPQRLAARSRDLGVAELRGIAHLHPKGVEVIEVRSLFGEALDLMASGADWHLKSAHGFEDGVDVTAGELAREVVDGATLLLVAASQVALEWLADEFLHAGQRTPELQLSPTGITAGASPLLRRGVDAHGLPTDQAVHGHGSPPAAPRDTQWAPTSYIPERWRTCRVFNLEVLEDNSYVVEGLVVHNCVHVLTPFVERLATDDEKKRGIISPDLLNKSPAELQRRFRKEFPGVARAAGKRQLVRAGRAGVAAARGRLRPTRVSIPEPELRALPAGTVLERTFKGQRHVVNILEGGKVYYEGRVYSSLTEAARAITGYRAISGPAFFGVAERGKRTGQAVAAARPIAAPPKLTKPKTDLELTGRTCDELAEMVGAKHGWNGDLRTGRGAFGGHKDWDCAISIGSEARNRLDAMLKHDAASWAKLSRNQKMEMTSSFNTLVHEATHAMGMDGAIKTHEYATAAQRWIEEGLTAAGADETAPKLFERIMGFPSGLDKRDFAGMASYGDYQQALAKALGGPYAGRSMFEPMRGIDPKLYLDLAYRTPRDQRLWELSQRMESYYGKTKHGVRTAVEIEAIVGHSPDHNVVVNFAEEALALQQARP